jgi:hypothetical protein
VTYQEQHMSTVSTVPLEAGEQSDNSLVEQVLAGNPASFELLMRRHN